MSSRIRMLVLLVGVLSLAGCTTQLDLEAVPATVSSDAAASHGYRMQEPRTVTTEYQDRFTEVTLTSWKTTYKRDVPVEPQIEADEIHVVYEILSTRTNLTDHNWLGQQNPLLTDTHDTMAEHLGHAFNNTVRINDQVAQHELLHNSTDGSMWAEKHEITIDIGDYISIDGYLVSAQIRTDDMAVLAYGAYPAWADEAEEDTILDLIRHTYLNKTQGD